MTTDAQHTSGRNECYLRRDGAFLFGNNPLQYVQQAKKYTRGSAEAAAATLMMHVWSSANMLHTLRVTWAVVLSGGRAHHSMRHSHYSDENSFLSAETAHRWLSEYVAYRTTADNDTGAGEVTLESMNVWRLWSNDQLKRRNSEGVTFVPYSMLAHEPLLSEIYSACLRGKLNMFCGWHVLPRRDDDLVQLVLEHIRQVWCNGDRRCFEYAANYFAHAVQRPYQLRAWLRS